MKCEPDGVCGATATATPKRASNYSASSRRASTPNCLSTPSIRVLDPAQALGQRARARGPASSRACCALLAEQGPLDIDRVRVVALDQIGIIAIHLAHETRQRSIKPLGRRLLNAAARWVSARTLSASWVRWREDSEMSIGSILEPPRPDPRIAQASYATWKRLARDAAFSGRLFVRFLTALRATPTHQKMRH
jgi:hypothetical protein